jgi:hypothetical protein
MVPEHSTYILIRDTDLQVQLPAINQNQVIKVQLKDRITLSKFPKNKEWLLYFAGLSGILAHFCTLSY